MKLLLALLLGLQLSCGFPAQQLTPQHDDPDVAQDPATFKYKETDKEGEDKMNSIATQELPKKDPTQIMNEATPGFQENLQMNKFDGSEPEEATGGPTVVNHLQGDAGLVVDDNGVPEHASRATLSDMNTQAAGIALSRAPPVDHYMAKGLLKENVPTAVSNMYDGIKWEPVPEVKDNTPSMPEKQEPKVQQHAREAMEPTLEEENQEERTETKAAVATEAFTDNLFGSTPGEVWAQSTPVDKKAKKWKPSNY